MEFKTKKASCRWCGWMMTFPDTPDYSGAAEDEVSRHIENVHGFIGVLKHEYEINNAVESAHRRGVEEGRKMLSQELTKIIEKIFNDSV